MRYVNIIIATFLMADVGCHNNVSSIVNVQSLSVLPLEALLNIRRNLLNFDIEDATESNVTDELKPKEGDPQALPFVGLDDIKKKGGYYIDDVLEHHSKYEKKKNVTKIFQLSVTSLAFLAFGGYLLFLIIAAIKSKTYDYYPYDPNTTHLMSAIVNAELNKRRRKKKRPIRGHGHFEYKENDSLEKDDKTKKKRAIPNARIDTEEMYRVLINLCEGYSKIMGAETV